MPAQQRKLKKNYIGILSDKLDEQRPADPPAKSGRLMKEYLLGLMAAVLNRRGGAGSCAWPSRPSHGAGR